LIKKKSEVFEVLKKFKSLVDRQSGHKIKTLRIDGGGDYVSSEFGATLHNSTKWNCLEKDQ